MNKNHFLGRRSNFKRHELRKRLQASNRIKVEVQASIKNTIKNFKNEIFDIEDALESKLKELINTYKEFSSAEGLDIDRTKMMNFTEAKENLSKAMFELIEPFESKALSERFKKEEEEEFSIEL